MIDKASEEDIRIAKEHLDRALARAVNRDSLRWVNPPTYQVDTTYMPAEQFDQLAIDLDEPQQYDSLGLVPPGVVVRDRDGDEWKIKRDGTLRIRWKGGDGWEKANEAGYPLSAWDNFAPFIEVKEK